MLLDITTVWWSSCVTKIQEPLRGLWGCLLQCTMKLCKTDISPYQADHQLESTPWTRPEGGLSKLCIGKCEDQPCAVALCRASDDAERCLPVIRQSYGSGTTVLRPWSTRVRQCYRRDAGAVSRGNLPFFSHVRARANLYQALHVAGRGYPCLASAVEQPPTAIPRTNTYKTRPSTNYWPIITTYDHVQQIS